MCLRTHQRKAGAVAAHPPFIVYIVYKLADTAQTEEKKPPKNSTTPSHKHKRNWNRNFDGTRICYVCSAPPFHFGFFFLKKTLYLSSLSTLNGSQENTERTTLLLPFFPFFCCCRASESSSFGCYCRCFLFCSWRKRALLIGGSSLVRACYPVLSCQSYRVSLTLSHSVWVGVVYVYMWEERTKKWENMRKRYSQSLLQIDC